MKKNVALIVLIVFISFLANTPLPADDIENEIKTGLTLYKKGEYTESINSLELAAQQIRQLKAGKIETLFPPALAGWRADAAQSTAAGAVFMGGFISGSKRYTRGDSAVEIEIATDSPMISLLSAMFSNPVMMTMAGKGGDNTRVINIQGKKAMLEWDARKKEGNMKIIIENRVLVSVAGTDCKESDLQDYANAIDYNKIKDYISK